MKNSDKYLLLVLALFLMHTTIGILHSIGTPNDKGKCIEIYTSALNDEINGFIILDVRSKQDYKNKRIRSALSYPFAKRNIWKRIILNEIKLDSKLVIYCDSNLCNLSSLSCTFLKELGYKNIFILKGGITLWEKHGYPLARSY